MSTPSRSASARASALGRTLKPITSAFEADARLTSFSVIPPTPVWMTLTRTSECWILPSSPSERLDGALHVALEDDVEILDDTLLQLREQALERDAALRALRQLLAAEPLGPLLREILGLPLVLDDARQLAGRRRPVEAEDLDGLAGARLLDLLALVVVERAHLARRVTRDDRVTDAQRAAVDEHRRDRAAADVEPRLDDRPGGLGRSGSRADRARRRRRAAASRAARRGPSFCLADTSANWVVPPHSSGCSPSEASSERTRSRFAFGTSILLTATTIGTSAARACEIDSRVCGITPSSAATTRIAMSVTLAPRARMAVNASWPGVSRKVILRPLMTAW